MFKRLSFLSDRWIIFNFGPSRKEYFSLQNNSLRVKIRAKTDEISQKYQNPNKVFTEFFRKTGNFLLGFAQ